VSQSEEDALRERIARLDSQVSQVTRGLSVAARADGAPVVTSDSTSVGRAIRLVLSEMRKEVPFDSCSVQELRDDRLVIIGGVGFADLDVLLGESFEVDSIDNPNGAVIHRRKPLNVGDTEKYRAFRRGLHVGSNIRSWLGVPLQYGDRLLGMIALDKAEPAFYTVTQEEAAIAFAGLIARAMADASEQEEKTYA
jgi:GAF domain-containing protein